MDYDSDKIVPWDLRSRGPSANVPIVMKVMDSASTYSSIWETGNIEKTDDIMVEDMLEVCTSPVHACTSDQLACPCLCILLCEHMHACVSSAAYAVFRRFFAGESNV